MIQFQDILQAVDHLSQAELDQLQARINQRRQPQPDEAAQLMADIQQVFQTATPTEVKPGTLDVEALESALTAVRADLTPEEFAEVEKAMNAEYVAPTDDI